MSTKISDIRWKKLVKSFGLDERYIGECKTRAGGKIGVATDQLTEIKRFADSNGVDINVVMAQVLVRDVFIDLAQAAESWGKILRAIMRSAPCQQAQYSLMDVEAIKGHCDSFIKYGPKEADLEIPLEASEYVSEPQMTEEEYAAHLEKEAEEKVLMLNSDVPRNDAEPETH